MATSPRVAQQSGSLVSRYMPKDKMVLPVSSLVLVVLAALAVGVTMMVRGAKTLRTPVDGSNLINARLLVAGGAVLVAAPVLACSSGCAALTGGMPKRLFG